MSGADKDYDDDLRKARAEYLSWRDVPVTAGMLYDAIYRWNTDKTGLGPAIQQAAQAKFTE